VIIEFLNLNSIRILSILKIVSIFYLKELHCFSFLHLFLWWNDRFVDFCRLLIVLNCIGILGFLVLLRLLFIWLLFINLLWIFLRLSSFILIRLLIIFYFLSIRILIIRLFNSWSLLITLISFLGFKFLGVSIRKFLRLLTLIQTTLRSLIFLTVFRLLILFLALSLRFFLLQVLLTIFTIYFAHKTIHNFWGILFLLCSLSPFSLLLCLTTTLFCYLRFLDE